MSAKDQDSRADSALRTVVFVDYQNVYRGARRAYGWDAGQGHFGNAKPIALGRMLTQGADRELEQVRVYTGVPTTKRDKRGNKIMQRRLAAWVNDYPAKVEIFPRPLRYPPSQGREKGVDVELAIDLVRLAMDEEFDVAIIASTDTDLLPPIEFILSRFPEKIVETAAFQAEPGCEAETAEPLDVSVGTIGQRHKMPKHVFEKAVADRRNFMEGKPGSIADRSRWEKISRRLAG